MFAPNLCFAPNHFIVWVWMLTILIWFVYTKPNLWIYVCTKSMFCTKPFHCLSLDVNNSDLVCLHQTKSELLTSRLKQWNLLDWYVWVTDERKRHQDFSSFFATVNGLCLWHNVNGLFDLIEIPFIPNDWRLFTGRSSRSLKGVLASQWKQISIYPFCPLSES